jgi:hypothetical protein
MIAVSSRSLSGAASLLFVGFVRTKLLAARKKVDVGSSLADGEERGFASFAPFA